MSVDNDDLKEVPERIFKKKLQSPRLQIKKVYVDWQRFDRMINIIVAVGLWLGIGMFIAQVILLIKLL